MNRPEKPIYEFGSFRLVPSERLLLREGKAIALTMRTFKILLVLVQNSGHLVEKESLLEAVWPNVFVEEANLAQHIFRLRRALGESRSARAYIETVPKAGYRFTAIVREVSDNVAEPIGNKNGPPFIRQIVTSSLSEVINSIAILPLIKRSGDPDTNYLSEAITERLIGALSQLPQLRVMARSTVFRYKAGEVDPQEIGRDLNVQALLVGTIVQLRDTFVVRVELIDVIDGSHLWGGEYKHQLSDVFEVQEEISRAILEELRIRLMDQETSHRVLRCAD